MILEPKQIQALEILESEKYKDICLYGSGRSGKSFLETYFVFKRSLLHPGTFSLFIRETYTALIAGIFTQTIPAILDAFKIDPGVDLIDKGVIRLKHSPAEIAFANGSSCRFLGLDEVSTSNTATDKILSQEYNLCVMEECGEIDFSVVEKVKTRLAQKVEGARPIALYSLNPGTYDSWTYKYFEQKINPRSKVPVNNPNEITSVFFHVSDNLNNISPDYIETLNNLSPQQRRRFLDGVYGETFEGEIFKEIYWETLPDASEFERIIVYNDPSYKSSNKNDYKATVAVGLCRGAFWVIWCEANQGTTVQMIMNNHITASKVYEFGWQAHVDHWFENAGIADDFEDSIKNYAEHNGWVCPFRLDSRQKGDKYSRIEGCLVPLNDQGKLFFNKELKSTRVGNLINQQFLNFRFKMNNDEHDDIPDAVHGAISLINMPVLKAGGTKVIMRTPRVTL